MCVSMPRDLPDPDRPARNNMETRAWASAGSMAGEGKWDAGRFADLPG